MEAEISFRNTFDLILRGAYGEGTIKFSSHAGLRPLLYPLRKPDDKRERKKLLVLSNNHRSTSEWTVEAAFFAYLDPPRCEHRP